LFRILEKTWNMRKIKTGYLIVGVFVLLLGLLFMSNYLKSSNETHLNENGIETFAKITKIDVNNYRANEMDGTFVENYVLTFQFLVNEETVESIRTIEKKDYDAFFKRTLYVNDSVKILYDASEPKNNLIKKLNLPEN